MAYEVRSYAVVLEVLALLYAFCSAHEAKPPIIVGVSVAELEQKVVGKSADKSSSAKHTMRSHHHSSVSMQLRNNVQLKEAEEIKGLLEAVPLGAGNLEQLKESLESELIAIEEANVHGILESKSVVEKVVGDLHSALSLLDDLEESLNLFDAKLSIMKEDVATIEERNNELEIAASNKRGLEASLETLLKVIRMPAEIEKELAPPEGLKLTRLDTIVAAATELLEKMDMLSANGNSASLSPQMLTMAAVTVRKQQLQTLTNIFLDKVQECVEEQLQAAADDMLVQVSAMRTAQHIKPADKRAACLRRVQLRPLVRIALQLQPSVVDTMGHMYCKSIGMVTCRELEGVVAELSKKGMPSIKKTSLESSPSSRRFHTKPKSRRTPSMTVHDRQEPSTMEQSMQSQQAYSALMDNFLPAIADEISHMVDFLAGNKTLPEQFINQVQTIMTHFIDALQPAQQGVSCLSMLETTLKWKATIESPLLSKLVNACQDKLMDAFVQYSNGELQKIKSEEAILLAGNNKIMDVFRTLPAMLSWLEGCDLKQTPRGEGKHVTALPNSPFDQPIVLNEECIGATPFEQQHASLELGKLVTEFLHNTISTAIETLERVARTDPRRGQSLLLLNYEYFISCANQYTVHLPQMEEFILKKANVKARYVRLLADDLQLSKTAKGSHGYEKRLAQIRESMSKEISNIELEGEIWRALECLL